MVRSVLRASLAADSLGQTMAEPDQAAAVEVTAAIGRACDACHKVYREGDPAARLQVQRWYSLKTKRFDWGGA